MEANKFMESLAKAQNLMLDETFNNRVESAANAYKGKSKNGASAVSSSDISRWEQQAFGTSYSAQPQQYQMIQVPQGQGEQQGRKLPQSILESFAQQPPMSGEGAEHFDTMSQITNRLSLPQQVNEQVMQRGYQQPMPAIGGIDYSLLRTIIDESVKRNLSELMGSLNESTIRGIKLSKGNKIQMLDMKGNLYEGVLTLKKTKE